MKKYLVIEELENAGCNNGNYPKYEIQNEKGETIKKGITCNCHKGCSNTDNVSYIKMK